MNLSACCDINFEQANVFAKRHHISQVFSDYKKLLDVANSDAVYLAVPHYLHYEMILSAVKARKSVLTEKPFTRTLEEGKQLIKEIGNAKVGVNYQYRYDRGCFALAKAIQTGVLGKVHSMRINIPWHREQEYFDEAPWHKTIALAGGGTLITQGSHLLDVALWGLADAPASTLGYTATPGFEVEVETLAHGIIRTRGGTLINITSSMVAASERAVTIEAYGEHGTALYRNLPWPSVNFVGVKVKRKRAPEGGVHAFQRSLQGFTKWILDDKPFLSPAESTLPVLAALDGIYRSAASGLRVQIED